MTVFQYLRKKIEAHRLIRKALWVFCVDKGYTSLSAIAKEEHEPYSKDGIRIYTTPNIYCGIADIPGVSVFLYDEATKILQLVLRAIAYGKDEKFNVYQITCFHSGVWTKTLEKLYAESLLEKKRLKARA